VRLLKETVVLVGSTRRLPDVVLAILLGRVWSPGHPGRADVAGLPIYRVAVDAAYPKRRAAAKDELRSERRRSDEGRRQSGPATHRPG
jgi:hypothetical protein